MFSGNETGDYDLYRITAAGTNLSQLTVNTWQDADPAYTPRGLDVSPATQPLWRRPCFLPVVRSRRGEDRRG